MTLADDARRMIDVAIDGGPPLLARLLDQTRAGVPQRWFDALGDRDATDTLTLLGDVHALGALAPPDDQAALTTWIGLARTALGRRSERAAPADPDATGLDPALGVAYRSRQERTKHEVLDDLVTVQWFAGGARVAPAVAYVTVPRFKQGQPFRHERPAGGTAFLIAPDLVMTAFHVVEARDRASETPADPGDLGRQVAALRLMFDYERRDANDRPSGTPVAVSALVASDPALDVAVLRLAAPSTVAPVVFRQAPLPAVDLGLGFVANIIQHPSHEPKKVGLRNNAVYELDAKQLYYFTDTKGGSSGAPVFDDDWRVIAIHTGWDPVAGTEPLYLGRTMAVVNRGTLAARLIAWCADPARAIPLTIG